MPGRGTATGLSHVLVGLCRGGILWDTPVPCWDPLGYTCAWWDPVGYTYAVVGSFGINLCHGGILWDASLHSLSASLLPDLTIFYFP